MKTGYESIPTYVKFINRCWVYICPYSGRTRYHRYGIPKYEEEGRITLHGSFTTLGCAISYVIERVKDKTISEDDGLSMMYAVAQSLGVNAKMKDAFTFEDAVKSLAITPAPPPESLQLFGGNETEDKWARRYGETDQMKYSGYENGPDLCVNISDTLHTIRMKIDTRTFLQGKLTKNEQKMCRLYYKMHDYTHAKNIESKMSVPPSIKTRKRKRDPQDCELIHKKKKVDEDGLLL